MARREIKIYPDRILRRKARLVDKVGEEEKRLICDMIETMRAAEGVGLAAPQVGVNRRIIVIEDLEKKDRAAVLINPRILKRSGRSRFCEGCLSLPGITSDVVRPEHIIVEALNLQGERVNIHTGGLFARIVQHEVDHLDGILFIDRVGFFKRKKLVKLILRSSEGQSHRERLQAAKRRGNL